MSAEVYGAGAAGGSSAVGVGTFVVSQGTGTGVVVLTSGLKALGTVVGGGLGAGAVTAVAAPLAVAGAAYGLFKWLSS